MSSVQTGSESEPLAGGRCEGGAHEKRQHAPIMNAISARAGEGSVVVFCQNASKQTLVQPKLRRSSVRW